MRIVVKCSQREAREALRDWNESKLFNLSKVKIKKLVRDIEALCNETGYIGDGAYSVILDLFDEVGYEVYGITERNGRRVDE